VSCPTEALFCSDPPGTAATLEISQGRTLAERVKASAYGLGLTSELL